MTRFHIEVEHPRRCVGCFSCVYACSRHLFNIVDPSRVAVFVRSNKTLANNFEVIACRSCKSPECTLACLQGALQTLPEGGVTLISSKCSSCITFDCTKACEIRALALDRSTKLPIVCDQCGDCAKYCPHNVFKYMETRDR